MSEKDRKQQQERFDAEKLFRVALVGIYYSGKSNGECLENLEELKSLATTAGFEVVAVIPCPIKALTSATYIGIGKAEEIGQLAEKENIDAIIFDDEISPNQQKNLEEAMGRPVLDRTELILEVFAQRAQSKEATLQIELARVRYQLPRLKRMWTHLSRQKTGGGGGGYLRGTGETQLETDKRLLKARLNALEREIKEIHSQREVQRRSRLRGGIPTFAIVGYTNAGKSTLLNALTDAGVFVEDKLFATLDTTARKFTLPNNQNVVLIDTVGFIRKLPHTLVAAFRSTLEETCYTDILLHVVDISHPAAVQHAETTLEVLKELGSDQKPMITVLNKIDKCENQMMMNLFRIKYPKTARISATTREGFEDLLQLMINEIALLCKVVRLRIPQSHYALASELMKEGRVIHSDYEENDILMEVEIPAKLEHKVRGFYDEGPAS